MKTIYRKNPQRHAFFASILAAVVAFWPGQLPAAAYGVAGGVEWRSVSGVFLAGEPATVPEPATVGLLLMGAGVLVATRPRKRL